MYKITVTDPSGAFIEKSPVCGEQQAIAIWEDWYDKYHDKNITIKLLRRSTVVLAHSAEMLLQKSAVQEYFASKKPVGRPPSDDPAVKLFFQLPQSVLDVVDAKAEERGLTRPQYLRMFVTTSHID